MSDKAARKIHPGVRRVLPVLVSLLLLAVAFHQLSLEQLLASAQALSAPVILGLLALVLLRVAMVSLRWSVLLNALACPVGPIEALRLTYCGAFLNSLLPGSVAGDPYRIYAAANAGPQSGGNRLSGAIAATLLDRLIGLGSLCLLCGASLPFLSGLVGDRMTMGPILLACAAILGLGVAVAACLLTLDKLIPARFAGKAASALRRMSIDLRRLREQPRALISILGLSVLGHLCLAGMPVLVLLAAGIPVGGGAEGFLALWAIAFPVILAQMMPFSLNGWGVRELAAVGGFGLLGISAADALTASIATGLANTLALLPAVIFLMIRSGSQGRGILKAGKAPLDSPPIRPHPSASS